MTYARLGHEWWFDLRPLCASPCHKIVTAVSRALRPQVSVIGYAPWPVHQAVCAVRVITCTGEWCQDAGMRSSARSQMPFFVWTRPSARGLAQTPFRR